MISDPGHAAAAAPTPVLFSLPPLVHPTLLSSRAYWANPAAFLTQKVQLDEATVKFEIWDTAGQERYRSLAPMYYRGAAAAIVVYDVTNKVNVRPGRGRLGLGLGWFCLCRGMRYRMNRSACLSWCCRVLLLSNHVFHYSIYVPFAPG